MGCVTASEVSMVLTSEFRRIIEPVNFLKPSLMEEITEIQNKANDYIQTPPEILEEVINDISSSANNWISNYASDECYQTVIDWIERCNFFSDPLFNDPLRFLYILSNNVSGFILGKVREISRELPEVDIATSLLSVWMQMSSKTSNVISAISKLLDISDCFADLGEEISEIIVAIEQLMDDLFLTVDAVGNIILNIDKILTGLVLEQVQKIVGIFQMIGNIIDQAMQKISTGIEFFRNKLSKLQKSRDEIII